MYENLLQNYKHLKQERIQIIKDVQNVLKKLEKESHKKIYDVEKNDEQEPIDLVQMLHGVFTKSVTGKSRAKRNSHESEHQNEGELKESKTRTSETNLRKMNMEERFSKNLSSLKEMNKMGNASETVSSVTSIDYMDSKKGKERVESNSPNYSQKPNRIIEEESLSPQDKKVSKERSPRLPKGLLSYSSSKTLYSEAKEKQLERYLFKNETINSNKSTDFTH